MTQPKTIPADPKPVVGERMAVYNDYFQAWDVYQWHDGPGGPFRLHIAIHLSEKDALLLVYGRAFIELVERTPTSWERVQDICAALANLKGTKT